MKKKETTNTIPNSDDKYGVTREEAYKLLGVNETSTVDEIEKAYERIAIKHKSLVKQNIATIKDEMFLGNCTEAYNLLTKRMTKEERERKQKWFVGFNFKSVSNFFYVYGWQTVLVLAIIGVVCWFIYDMTHKPQFDLQVHSLGSVQYNEEAIERVFKELDPDLENPSFSKGMNAGHQEKESNMYSDQQSEKTSFMAKYTCGDIDIVFMSKTVYEAYSQQPYFVDLTDVVKDKNVKKYKSLYDGKICGINVSNNKYIGQYFSDTVIGGDIVLAVTDEGRNRERAINIVRKLIE